LADRTLDPCAKMTIPLLTATMSITRFMIKTILVALVGMGMGGMVGLLVDLLGVGNLAIFLGAALGGLVFSFAAPRIGRLA
jgi:hypothetical protein